MIKFNYTNLKRHLFINEFLYVSVLIWGSWNLKYQTPKAHHKIGNTTQYRWNTCADRSQGFLNASRVGCVGHILVVIIKFNKGCTKIMRPVLYTGEIVSPHNCHSYAARLESLRLCQTGNTRQILVHNSRWWFSILSLLLRAPVAWKCRNGRMAEEKPFHHVWTLCKTSMVSIACLLYTSDAADE